MSKFHVIASYLFQVILISESTSLTERSVNEIEKSNAINTEAKILIKNLKSLRNDLTTVIEEQKSELELMKDEKLKLSNEIKELQNSIASLKEEQKLMKAEKLNITNDVKSLQNSIETLQTQQYKSDGEILSLTGKVEQCSIDLEDHVAKQLTPPFIWKIKQFTEHRNADRILYKPFSTSKYSYKMQLQLYTNGSYSGDTHMSVYLEVLPGEYDCVLKWPVSCRAEFRVLDRVNGSDHYSVTLKRTFKKGDEAWGFANYFPFDKLKPPYLLIDDTLYFELRLSIKNY